CTSWSIHDSVAAVKRGTYGLTVCSTAFTALGRSQATAFGYPTLPIAAIPHPFGARPRADVGAIAQACVEQIAHLICAPDGGNESAQKASSAGAELIEAPADAEAFNQFCFEQKWSDGLPVVAPTAERVARMLSHTRRGPNEVIAAIAPAYGAATT